jgi:ribosome modulation factor
MFKGPEYYEQVRKAKTLGAIAFYDGRALKSCPYTAAHLRGAFRAGFDEAKKEAAKPENNEMIGKVREAQYARAQQSFWD